MKKVLLSSALFLISFIGFSQTKGISYQAVIIDPNPIQIPGSDVTAQPYVSKEVWIRFGIYAGTTLQYEELHKTKTDEYGLVNLIIGAGVNTGKAGTFTSLSWDGITKNILTSVSFDQGGRYTDVSNQKLNYTPYTLLAETAVKLAGVLPVASGGTGATNAIAARTNLGLGNVDNTADADKPVSIATLAILDTKEAIANKSTNIIADSASSVKYPSVKAIKDYVDSRTSSANNANLAAKATALATPRTINGVAFDGTANITIPVGVTPADADSTTKGILQLAGDLSGTAASPRIKDGAITNAKITSVSGSKVTGDIAGNAATATLASSSSKLATARTINGIAFDGTADITIPVGVTPVDANATTKGILQLAGDLSGTAALPRIAQNAVTTSKLADGSVTDAKINTVSGSKVTGDIAGNAATATKLTTARTINGTAFDGTADITITTNASTLSGTIGLVNGGTGASTAAAARTNLGLEIGTDVLAQRTFGTAANSAATDFVAATEKGANNGVATLGNNGKIPSTQIPAISFQNVNVVNSDAAMIGIAGAQVGSIAIRTDNNNNYVLSALPASTLSNWIALATPLYVSTVNGYAGPNVVLTTNDVAEGTTNKYFTDARVRNAISAVAPLNFNTTSGVLSMTAASTTSNGYLSSADFTTFNNKQTALTAGVDYATPSGNITGNAANVTGIVSIANGGTGTSTATGALVALGAEPSANKSNDVDGDGSSITKFPTVKSIKDYVDRQSANAGVADNSITSAKINGTIAIAKGGTGASTAAGARTNLGLAIGTDVMAANATTALTGDVTGSGNGSFATTVNSVGGVSSSTIATLPGLITTNTNAIAANTASITANTNSIATNATAITTEATTARAAELTLTNSVNANTASITANSSDIATINNILALKAPLASPAFTGTPTAPTPVTSDNSTKVATTEYVKASITAANAGLSTVGAISATPNAKGATISGTTELILTPADATNGGVVTTGAQTFAGAKTFSNDITVREILFGYGTHNKTNNIAIGRLALNNNTSDYNVAIGNAANSQAASTSGGYNVALGYQAMRFPNSRYNVAIGSQSFYSSAAPSSGDNNVAVGYQAFYNPGTGANNTVLGFQSLYNGGANNSILGAKALYNAAGASNNVAVGDNAGLLFGSGSGTALTSSTQSIFIGSGVRAGTNTSTNEIAIGYNVVGNGSNTVTIGNYSNTANYFRGDINLTGNVNGGTWSGTTIDIAKGGTGATTAAAALTNLGAEATVNKSIATDLGGANTSDILFPTQKAVKSYVDAQTASAGVSDGSITNAKLAGSITSSKLVGTDITTVGTITTGTWSASVIDIAHGGTGSSTVTGAKTNLGLNNVENTALSTWTGSTNITTVGALTAQTKTFMFQDLILGYGANNQAKIQTDASTKYLSFYPNYNVESTRMWPSGNLTIQTGGTFTDNGYKLEVAGTSKFTGNASIVGNLDVTGNITSATWSGTTIPLTKGGTGATTAADARTNLGLVIGTDVMAANYTTTLTGDVTGAGNGSFATTLAASGVTSGTYGSSTAIPTFTVDSKGRLTAASTVGITAGVSTLAYSTTGASNGGTISGTTLTLTAADASNPGLISTGAQTIAGAKTFTNTAAFNTDISVNGLTVGRGAGAVASNTALGATALNANTSGNYNVAVGSEALQRNTAGSVNVALGAATIDYLTSGNNNTAVGGFAGRTYGPNGGATGNNTTMNNGILLGYDARPLASGGTDEVVIGMRAIGHGSNTVTLGNSSNTKTFLTGDLSLTGNITSGIWSATEVAIAKGGTGATTASGARTNLGLGSLATKSTIANADVASGAAIDFSKLNITRADISGLGIQDGLTAGSGISLSSGTISVTGLTTSNLASNAAITNAQLANSSTTLGSTTMTLGGTVTSVTGLESVTSTGFTGALTGNASTATKLAATKTINGVAFDGSANITIAADANTLTGTTLASNVVTSSLTSVGTITSGVWSGTAIANNKLANSTTTLGSTTMTLGGTVTSVTGLTSLTATTVVGSLSGTATTATNIAGGVVGSIPYQTAAGTTALLAGNTTSTVKYLASSGNGTNSTAPTWVTPSFVPYSGATAAVDLGAYDLTVNSITVGRGNSGDGTNTALGASALQTNTGGVSNTGIGYYALKTTNGNGTTGSYNVALGYSALSANTTGSFNVASGANTLASNTSGNKNSAFGNQSLNQNTTGGNNVGFGFSSLYSVTTASDNTAIGTLAGYGLTTGARNTLLGSYAGAYFSTGNTSADNNTTGLNSVLIGYDVRPLANGDDNEIVISGYNGTPGTTPGTIGWGSNSTSIGNTKTQKSRLYGALTVTANSAAANMTGTSSTIAAQNATTATFGGGDLNLTAGNAGTTGLGGNIYLTPGTSSTAANKGIVQINGQVKITGGSPGAGEVLMSDVNGLATWSYSIGSTVVTSTSTYAITLAEAYVFYTGSAAGTFTIPDPASTNAGKEITIKNKTAFGITISPASTGKIYIDSANTAVNSVSIGIEASNNWIKLVSDGTQWNVIRALF
jgi:hypothetical protein